MADEAIDMARLARMEGAVKYADGIASILFRGMRERVGGMPNNRADCDRMAESWIAADWNGLGPVVMHLYRQTMDKLEVGR